MEQLSIPDITEVEKEIIITINPDQLALEGLDIEINSTE